jgi:hypothetical protein
MPRRSFPEFRGLDESKIGQYLRNCELDRSYQGNYSIDYSLVGRENSEHEIASWKWNDITRIREDGSCHPARQFVQEGAPCWGDLTYDCHTFYKIHGEFPKWLLFRFQIDPFANGASVGIEEDDYYDDDYYYEDDYERERGADLEAHEIYRYCDWLVKHRIVKPFDVDHFMQYDNGGFGYLDLDNYFTMNQIYFACTMVRYMHEGQNIVRRIIKFDRLFDLDPFVNVVLAHQFANYYYNSGHCVCAMEYWEREQFGGDSWSSMDLRPIIYKQYPPLFYAKVASAIRIEMDKVLDSTHKDKYKELGYPYFKWENQCGKNFNKLTQMTTPKAWRGLLSLDTRRSKCVNSALDAIQKCSSKTKAA